MILFRRLDRRVCSPLFPCPFGLANRNSLALVGSGSPLRHASCLGVFVFLRSWCWCHAGLKPKDVAKKLGKKFATGAAVNNNASTNEKDIDVQVRRGLLQKKHALEPGP